MENIKNIPSDFIWILCIGLVLGDQTFHVLSSLPEETEGSTMEWVQSDYHNNSSFRGEERLRFYSVVQVKVRQRQPLLSSSSSTSNIHLQTLFALSSVECPKQKLLLIANGDLGHAWAYKAHEIPVLVYKDSHQSPHCVISILLISGIVSCSVLDGPWMDWMDHACINGISPDCMTEINKSSISKLLENRNNSHKRNTVKTRRIGRSNLKGHTHGCHTTKRSLLQCSKCATTSNFQIQSSQHAARALDNFTQHTRRNHKTSVWIFLFFFLLSFTNVAASPRDVPVKKCCPDGQVLDGSASCIPGSATSPFNSILRGLDPSKSNYRDHPVDIRLISMGSTGEPLPGRPRKLYKLEQGTAWLTVGGNLITSEFEAEFPHGEICVDSTMWGERAAVIKYPCKGNLCLTLCCPHGQALVDDPTIEAAIDENVPKICGNFDWEWELKFWNKTNNAETTATRNYDFVLREDVEHASSFSCPSNCGDKKGTLGFADSTYSQVRLYSDGTLSGKLGDTTHLIENERFCVAYGDPPNYDYGEADTGMRVTYMVCSQPKCPPTEHGLPDAAKDKSASLASMGWFPPLVIVAVAFIVLVVTLLVFGYRKYKRSQDENGNQPNSRGTNGTMEMSGRSGRGQVNIQTLSGDIDAAEHV